MHYVQNEFGEIDLWDFPGGNLYGRAYRSHNYDQWIFDGTGNHFTAGDLEDIHDAMKRINWAGGLPDHQAGDTREITGRTVIDALNGDPDAVKALKEASDDG